ncbi:hypothetical protein B7486_62795, partial [cyanobacterium TDX16]
GCSDDDSAGSGTEDSVEGGAGGESADSGSSTGDAVAIVDFTFDPGDLTVPAGTTVTFTNEDGADHTATGEDGSFDTDVLEEGDAAEVTFDEPGEISYFCDIHNYMTGTITVA